MLVALFPLFHYSYWRDAWILRFVGERVGPVLIRAGHPDDVSERRISAVRIRPPWAVVALGAVVVAAVLGFVIAHNGSSRQARLAASTHASAGRLEVMLPAGWHRAAAAGNEGVTLTDEIAVHPSDAPGGLVIGRMASSGLGTLPQSLLATLPSAPEPEPVSLAGANFTRYAVVGSPKGTNVSESIYSLPTSVGTVLAVCRTAESQSRVANLCEQILASLTIVSGVSVPRLSPGYASGLTAAISSLDAVRGAAGSQLQRAPNAHKQSVAARELAAAHTRAASQLLYLNYVAGSASTANLAAVKALRRASQAYTGLAIAAAHSNSTQYADAKGSLQRADSALRSAFAQLQSFGYRIG